MVDYANFDHLYYGPGFGTNFGNYFDLHVSTLPNQNIQSYTSLGNCYSLPPGFNITNAQDFAPIAKTNFQVEDFEAYFLF